jgi:hypothetical protein
MMNEDIMKVVKPAICNQLKSPASAQFPMELISIVGDDNRGYQISGFVDSQNGYGAMIRNDFSATVAVVNDFPVVTSSSVGVKASARGKAEFVSNYIDITILTLIGGAILYFITSKIVGL